MLDFHIKWFLVLVVNFLALLYFLNIVLFRPLLKIFEERDNAVKGSLDAAKASGLERERALEEMKAGLSEAAGKSKEIFEGLRAEGLAAQRELFSKASAEVSQIAAKSKADLRAESDRARKALRSDVEKFSEDIVKRLVGA